MTAMQKITAHVQNGNTAALICPTCSTVKHIAVHRLRGNRHSLKIRCRCQEVFHVNLNFRKYHRKQISLPGTYAILKPAGSGGGVSHIRNISKGGLGFTVSGKNPLQQDQLIEVEFHLNDRQMTKVKKQALVRSVNGNFIGCQFNPKEELGKELGFFIQF